MTRKFEIEEVVRDDGLSLGRLGDFVGFRLRRIQNQLSQEFASATTKYELRQGEFSALAIIAANPGVSQTMLAREIGNNKSATVVVIDNLERLRFAERRRLPKDRRRHALYATPEGETALTAMFEKLESVERDALDALKPTELHFLNILLDRIYRATFRG